MKIVYAANHGNSHSDDTEGHIAKALRELGHEVDCVPQGALLPEGDMLLFHKWIPPEFKGTKVCWYFDKIWKDRGSWYKEVVDKVDHIFITDGSWARNHPNKKLHILRQGIGDSTLGIKVPNAPEIAFVGSVYADRGNWVKRLQKRYPGQFEALQGYYNMRMNDLCASVDIFVAPGFPCDEFYWSNRIYLVTGSGGFLIHPRLKGLHEYTDDEVVFYDSEEEMFEKIDHYLEHPEEREKIRLAGYNKTKTLYTYKTRCQKLLEKIQAQ